MTLDEEIERDWIVPEAEESREKKEIATVPEAPPPTGQIARPRPALERVALVAVTPPIYPADDPPVLEVRVAGELRGPLFKIGIEIMLRVLREVARLTHKRATLHRHADGKMLAIAHRGSLPASAVNDTNVTREDTERDEPREAVA